MRQNDSFFWYIEIESFCYVWVPNIFDLEIIKFKKEKIKISN